MGKQPLRIVRKATQIIGHKNSLGDNPTTRVATVTKATAVRGTDAIMTNTPH